MGKGSSQMTSGTILPVISGPGKDKDVFVVSGLVVTLAAVIGTIWYYSSTDQAGIHDQFKNVQASEALNSSDAAVTPVAQWESKKAETPLASLQPRISHTDLYFELGRKGLTDEARKVLGAQAAVLKQDPNLGVLIQGYTDQQGSAGYNMQLGMKRAQTVKTELMNAGVAEHQIKTVSLGKDGVLCIDMSDVCRQMNRRVHLEIRAIGQEHMRTPVVATTPAPEATEASADPQSELNGSLIDNLVPSGNAFESDTAPPALEPGSGS